MTKKLPRRTQAERTATTRRALIDAAVEVLNARGYGGASTALIAKAAGVSRGSILHQFGTWSTLMVEVVRAVYEDEMPVYRELLRKTPAKGKRLSDWPAVVWNVLSRPGAIAVLEIFIGSRSDPGLKMQLQPIMEQIERDSVRRFQKASGLKLTDARETVALVVAVCRGLSIARGLTPRTTPVNGAARLLGDILRRVEESA